MRRFIIALTIMLAACGDSSTPTGPSNPGQPQGQTRSIAGRITDLLTGAGVQGARVAIGSAAAVTTGGDGSWRADVPPPSTDRILTTITAAGFQPRETYVAWTNNDRQNVAIDVLPDRPPFSLAFYRELVRDGLESPSRLEPVRRWTANPHIYLRTLNPKTGQPLAPAETAALLQNVRDAVSQLTGGLLSVGTVESGVAARPERVGTINIDIKYEPGDDYCGITFVGANPGSVSFNYERCTTPCAGNPLGPELIAHEIGHALGFWHVSSGVMQAEDFVNCPTVNFTDSERLHGSIAYRRPSGNLDIDRDPQSVSALAAPGGSPAIRCRRSRSH
ncbi:MAG: carboxypeptidase regulatory-like domain-containing protein [Acidobacteria bacterium]|nr:carboxypeptidase regulatory-like domain-containing protein [Acidobacteriota bacterium]